LVVPIYNEEENVQNLLAEVAEVLLPHGPFEALLVDDGSKDRSASVARELGATVISLPRTSGVGAALREGYRYGLAHGYDVVVVMAGNNKDAPEEIPALLDPIADGRADFVQGSRYLKKSANFGDMPYYRRVATRVHPVLFSLAAQKLVTTFSGHAASVAAVCWLGDGPLVATGGRDGAVRIWNVENGKESRRIGGFTGAVDVLVPLVGGRIAVGDRSGTVRVHGAADGKQTASFPVAKAPTTSLAASRDGRLLAVGSLDGGITIVTLDGTTAPARWQATPPAAPPADPR